MEAWFVWFFNSFFYFKLSIHCFIILCFHFFFNILILTEKVFSFLVFRFFIYIFIFLLAALFSWIFYFCDKWRLISFVLFPRQKINGSVRSTHACKPGEGIINVAKELNATMIVTGSRGHGKLRRTLLGSVSDYLIHHADIPVLVCRHQSFNWRHSCYKWLLKIRFQRFRR